MAMPPIGGNIRVPRKLRDVRPEYPTALRIDGARGTVVLHGRIGISGMLEDLRVVSTPHAEFANAAVEAVRQWEYDPTLLNCVAVDIPVTITVNFEHAS